MEDLPSAIAREARARHLRWDEEVWATLLAGPAQRLAAGLEKAGGGAEAAALLESYLRLGAEAVGRGYLYPEALGSSFLGRAWRTLLPEQLPALPPRSRAEALARCWNVAEGLEHEPFWLRRVFDHVGGDRPRLAALDSLLAEVSRRALGPPARRLEGRLDAPWCHLGTDDPRFLPGAVHFVSPTVVCVHDRLRAAAGGREAVTLGVWVEGAPVPLGPVGCTEEVPSAVAGDVVRRVRALDPRVDEVHATAANGFRAALSLDTSQFLVALLPARA